MPLGCLKVGDVFKDLKKKSEEKHGRDCRNVQPNDEIPQGWNHASEVQMHEEGVFCFRRSVRDISFECEGTQTTVVSYLKEKIGISINPKPPR